MMKLKDILSEIPIRMAPLPEKITIVYTEQGGRFYGTYVYSDAKKSHDSKLSIKETEELMKELGINIWPNGLPMRYNSGDDDKLDMIVKKLQDKGIDASHNDNMDVS